jgi:type IV secretory pathway TrbD component
MTTVRVHPSLASHEAMAVALRTLILANGRQAPAVTEA